VTGTHWHPAAAGAAWRDGDRDSDVTVCTHALTAPAFMLMHARSFTHVDTNSRTRTRSCHGAPTNRDAPRCARGTRERERALAPQWLFLPTAAQDVVWHPARAAGSDWPAALPCPQAPQKSRGRTPIATEIKYKNNVQLQCAYSLEMRAALARGYAQHADAHHARLSMRMPSTPRPPRSRSRRSQRGVAAPCVNRRRRNRHHLQRWRA
jgi:hypothetical protein